jgi:hypothetical protein
MKKPDYDDRFRYTLERSIVFYTVWRIALIRACARDLRLRMDPEDVSYGAIRRNQAKVIRARFC